MDTNCTVGTKLKHLLTGLWKITSIEFCAHPFEDGMQVYCTLEGIGNPEGVGKPCKMSAQSIVNSLREGTLKKVS